jgi:hypothetical protein
MCFLFRNGSMLQAPRHDYQLSFLKPQVLVAELHPESSLHDEEYFVFVVVVLPDELALKFVQLYVLSVELSSDVGLPVFSICLNFSATSTFSTNPPSVEFIFHFPHELNC